MTETAVYAEHGNDNGDWCPYSGAPVTTTDRCPQGCQSSASEEVCSECGGSLADNEGYDGLCGTCADKAETEGKWA